MTTQAPYSALRDVEKEEIRQFVAGFAEDFRITCRQHDWPSMDVSIRWERDPAVRPDNIVVPCDLLSDGAIEVAGKATRAKHSDFVHEHRRDTKSRRSMREWKTPGIVEHVGERVVE